MRVNIQMWWRKVREALAHPGRAMVARRLLLRAFGLGVVVALLSAMVLNYRKVRSVLVSLRSKKDRVVEALSPAEDPPERAETPEVSEYIAYLEGLGLRHFSAREIVRPHFNKRDGVTNHIPPRSIWPEIAPTLRVVDELRARLGSRATLLSLYRSPDYNTAIKGASQSRHMLNQAIDLKFACSSTEAFETVKAMREEGVFTGGIGWYPTFIHIDTRGYDATWGI